MLSQHLEETRYELSPSRDRVCPILDSVASLLLTLARDLFAVQDTILFDLYGQNFELKSTIPLPQMLEATIRLEQMLLKWKQSVPENLQRTPWITSTEESGVSSNHDTVFNRLSVILLLRYLNTRILLHRPILSAILQRIGHATTLVDDEDEYLQLLECGARSVRICEQSAMEIVDIVHQTSHSPALSAAWWMAAYYSQLSIPDVSKP